MNPMTDARRRDNIDYWRQLAPIFPFHAQAPTLDPSPTDVIFKEPSALGYFIVTPMGSGLSYWGFETAKGRDAFLAAYPQATELATEAVFGNPA